MNVIAAGYRAAHPGNLDAPSTIELMPLLDDAVGAQRESYLLLFGAVACVLLIACANIANLLLARFAGRRREIGARFALGASRGAVVRQLVSESMLLAVLGGAVGLLLAEWTLRALVALGADLIPRAAEISIDPIALVFTLMATLVTGLLIGLLPAMQASGVNVLDALKEAGPGSVGSGRHLRAGLLVVEVSLSLVLLIAAGLLLTSFARLQRVDPGFEPEGVFTAQIALPRHYSLAKRHRVLRAVLSTPRDAARRIVCRAQRPRAADRRPDADGGGGCRPTDSAAERTRNRDPASRVAALLQHAWDSAACGP